MKNPHEPDSTQVIIRHYLTRVLSLKYFYILCFVLFGSGAYLFNKYSQRVYEVSATIGSKADNQPSILSGSNNVFGRGSSYAPTRNNIDDDVNSLHSFSLVYSTVSDMNLEVSYFSEGTGVFKQPTELYTQAPFRVTIDKSHLQPIDTKLYIRILSDSTFILSASEKNAPLYNYIDNQIVREAQNLKIDTICKFNKTASSPAYKFSISLVNESNKTELKQDKLYYFRLNHLDNLSKNYLGLLDIQPLSFMSSIIMVNFRGNNIEKSLDFLNAYLSSYVEENLAKKNKIAVNTINFIDSQISEISDSLVKSESNLRNFRIANRVTDLSFQGQRTYEQLERIETERTGLELQQRYYNYVINYFRTNPEISGIMPPTSANIVDPLLNQLITNLFDLIAEKSSLAGNKSEKNIFIGQIDDRINLQKQAIIETVTNNLNTLNITLNELNYRYEKLSQEISNLPKTELNMVNIQRKFNLNDAIYTFLLQKRSEAAITLASNYPDFEILEPAREITAKIIKPQVTKTYFIMLFLGFLIPTLFLFIRELFDNTISSVYDVERITDKSVMGIVYSNRYKYESVVMKSPDSAIAESFRNIRNSLFNKLKSQNSKVIIITSSQPQDGKSFVSFNIAASIASVGIKTVIIDADLRRATLHKKFGIENSLGLSNYMVKSSTLNEVTHETPIENLYFIPAGPILPNPSELIAAGAFDELINDVKKEFEYIIIDSSPIGLVADTVQLMKYASHILLIARNNYSRKDILANALEIFKLNNVENFDVVVNDIDLKKSPYSSYTSYYIKGEQISI